MALQPFDLVLLEQELDAAGELLDRVLALAVHRVEIEAGFHLHAELGEPAGDRLVIEVGRMQHRLGRDAADIEAGAAQRLAALDAAGLEPELCGTDGGNITARAGADYQDVEIIVSHVAPLRTSAKAGVQT